MVAAGYQPDLIYDLGFHAGEDTEFYLKKGFRVVAVEANEALCRAAEARFAEAIAAGRLTLINRAIAAEPGEITFYENVKSVWGTVHPEWAERNRRLGAESTERRVMATTMAALLAEHGVPYYAKIDLEGMDLVALAGLGAVPGRPKYVSIESSTTSFAALRQEFETLTALGYDRFKLVSQTRVPKQRPPKPAREGVFVEHSFPPRSSGAFGEEVPGRWLSAAAAIRAYRPIFLRYALVGNDPLIRSPFIRRALGRTGLGATWYDTHARLADS